MIFKKNFHFIYLLPQILYVLFFKISYSKPIFGILAIPEPINDNSTFINETIDGAYINWLESAGAEIVPLHVWYSQSELEEILNQINGVLLQGAFRLLNFSSTWEKNAKFIFNYSVHNNLPIFGICLGFRMLNVMMSKNDSLITKMRNHGNRKVEFIPNITKKSTLFNFFKEKDFDSFEKNETTVFIHRFGITPEMFYHEKNLVKNFKLTSFGYDLDGIKFIDSIENDEYKIYGTQFHPEKTPFLRMKKYNRNHENDSLRRSQLLALKVVDFGRNYTPKKIIENIDYFRKKYQVISLNYNNGVNYKYEKEKNMIYFEKN